VGSKSGGGDILASEATQGSRNNCNRECNECPAVQLDDFVALYCPLKLSLRWSISLPYSMLIQAPESRRLLFSLVLRGF